uniref:Uncharacterized protein n=1 Tax=Chenopodium quinoa TaxID=63459 RepID=A0A803M2V4_CHEQI
MAKKVEGYRSTLPDHLKSCLASVLSSQRPAFSLFDDVSEPGPSCGPHSGAGSSHGNSSTQLEVDDGEKTPDEVQLLRDKISSNISAIPKCVHCQIPWNNWYWRIAESCMPRRRELFGASREFFQFRLMALIVIFLDLPHGIVSDGRAMGLVSAWYHLIC